MREQLERTHSSPAAAPVPARVLELLGRADAELLAAQFSSEPWEQLSHAHLAALRAGAAVVAARGTPSGRRAPRTVWSMLGVVAPELGSWSTYFAEAASLRAAVDAGRFELVGPQRAEEALCAAEDFVDAARELVTAEGGGLTGRTLSMRVQRVS
ncbi:SAV_6107 family HEPN domain-containing protein [Cellulomonas fengjieae]|uniref:Colicin transporter n=1 Tax=Cellulomonas fengjieae TaxID=2819978 RepID=A0ABS3SH91_9CELL|nr:SAV_6107 family HEPN domain-containing protein [Cellulomonas fengjieae]MBO3084335.1 colicin transporter [Cellulomonas fengjieae]MBO3103107.1 colicin transporter [Cellulomonas fengjieae]QVI67316.1 colicin transporter [Cellulomonas fengjieae]